MAVKGQIVTHFAQKFELPKKNGSFTLPGIGKLVLQKRKARKGRNPATGEAIKIPAKTVVKMRIAKTCKEAVVPARVK
jgi:DNA-binding protein HU-beta